MNKRLILSVSLVLLVGVASFVYASQIEGDVPIFEGWNLIYGLGNPSQLDDWVTSEKVNIKAIYAFIPTTQEYARVYPNPENSKIDLIGDGYLEKTAFWVYSNTQTSRDFNGRMNAVEYNLEEPLPISEHQLYAGWNFIGVVPEMVNKNLNELKGNCNIEKAHIWYPEENNWGTVSLNSKIPEESLMIGVVVQVSSNCKLGTSESDIPSVPNLP